MGIEATTKDYWIAPNAIIINLNALGDANRIQGSAASGAVISCYIESVGPGGENGDGLQLDNGRNPKRWPITISPTYFNTNTSKYVYAAIPRSTEIGTIAVIVFPSEKIDIYGKNESSEQIGSSEYFYIFLHGVISEPQGNPLQRVWAQEINDWGTLGTYADIIDLAKSGDWYNYDPTTLVVTFLRNIFMSPESKFINLKAIEATVDQLIKLNGKNLESVAGESTPIDSETAVVTPSFAVQHFLRKDTEDIAHGRLTFNKGFDSNEPSTTKGLSNTGDIVNTGNLVMGEEQTYTTTPVARSANFNRGYLGWEVDNRGNAEVESLTVRSLLQVTELLINRLQGQEGDTLFSDNDQIESVRQEGDSYVLTLKEKWEGYRTAQQYGNIVKGIVNTLAARSVSDVTEAESVESDGVNKYYTSWMYITGDSHTEPSLLLPNQIRVAVYGDDMVPAAKNFPPCRLMNIARWGCIDYGTPIEDGDSAETIAEKTRILDSIERRQRLFYITSSDGRIVKMRKVNSPILRPENFGTTLGTLPDFLYNWQQVAEKAIPGRDYLYAQGIVAQSIIQVYPNGDPKQVFVDCGEWVDGTGTADPPIGGGTYLCYEWHEEAGQWETHDVWHNGCKWRALQHQPVTSGGVKMYHEPKWNSQYWKLVEGDGSLEMYLVSSEGNLFRPGHVDTVVSPYLYCGSVDITADIDAQYWTWTRHTESSVDSGGNPVYTPADEVWNAAHTAVRELHLTNDDMPTAWSRDNKAVFTCTVEVNDGNDTIIVQNHVTA